jgi:membrane-associated phospholipid phosphatase
MGTGAESGTYGRGKHGQGYFRPAPCPGAEFGFPQPPRPPSFAGTRPPPMATPIDPSTPRRLLSAILAVVLLTVLAVVFVDLPAATWSHAHLRSSPVFPWLTHLVDPLVPAAAVLLAVVAAGVIAGWQPPAWVRTLVACGLAVMIAVVIKDQLKFACGRLWPETWTHGNPSWIANGAHGFFPFHGGEGWESFPSGHMTRMTAVMTVLWLQVPRWRWLWGTCVMLVALGLFGANYHFIGDMIAGFSLGAGCAVGVVAWMFRRSRRPEDEGTDSQRTEVSSQRSEGRGQ